MNYSILINTCDKFEDCWNPFFKLWSLYWKDCTGKVYLNTEYKDYSYPGLDIIAVKGCAAHGVPRNKRATWSQCLKWALEAMDTDIVLYMQEDYFLTGKVDNTMVEHFINVMKQDNCITCIQLTPAGIPPTTKANIDKLWHSDNNHFSYVSCQASLWRKETMLSLIREHETAWNFEWWGSKRAKYMGYDFLTVGRDFVSLNGYQIIPYVFTGIIGGKWNKDVVALFKEHGIEMDFSQRGFYERKCPTVRQRIKTKMSVWKPKSVIEILRLKYLSRK